LFLGILYLRPHVERKHHLIARVTDDLEIGPGKRRGDRRAAVEEPMSISPAFRQPPALRC
jgi:hypothetical protein